MQLSIASLHGLGSSTTRVAGGRASCGKHAPFTHATAAPPRLVTVNAMKAEERTAALNSLKGLNKPVQQTIDPAYTNGAAFLKIIGFSNPAEIARVLDIAMNPNSMFIDHTLRKGSKNASARSLDVDKDMQPVVSFLIAEGISKGDVLKIISAHPPVLSYSVEGRLQPFWAYLSSIGIKDVNAVVIQRPTLLGLDVEKNLRKIVDYLISVETPPEKICEYLAKSI